MRLKGGENLTETIHKEKMFVEDKTIEGCQHAQETHRRVVFSDENRTKVLVFGYVPASVFSDFEAGKTYWIEIRKVSNSD